MTKSWSPAAPGSSAATSSATRCNTHPDWHVTKLDKLTYAGRKENLHDVMDNPRHTFVHGDILRAPMAGPLVEAADYVVHFAAETHVDRSIMAAGDFIKTDVEGTFVLLEAARRNPDAEAVRADFHRRGLRQRARRIERRDRRTAAAQSVRGQQGRRRSAGLQLLGDPRRAGDRHARVEQLRAVPVPGKDPPAVRHQPDGQHPGAALRRRRQRPRLAARARSLPRASIC